jgi:uncharacterized protein (TIGR02270 family)
MDGGQLMRLSYFAVQDATRSFSTELYEEHLEEASLLYEQRVGLYNDSEITWLEIGNFEERFEAHIDGLVVGGDLAIEVCKRRAKEGDFGELHAALRVFCRQNRKDLTLAIVEELDLDDAEKVQAVGDALKYELPAAWNDDLWHLGARNRQLTPLLSKVSAYRRVGVAELGTVLHETQPQFLPDVIWACGRLRQPGICRELRTYLDHKDPAVQSAAAIALLRLGDEQVLDHCLRGLALSNWPAIPMGLAGSRTAGRILLDVGNGQVSYDRLIALGLLGDISAVPILLSSLTDDETAEAAAISLQLITGASFCEKVFVPDPVDEDELFDVEREDHKREKIPLHPDGRSFGVTVKRLSRKHGDWQQWWSLNNAAFDTQVRYRSGRPYSHGCLVDVLTSERSLHLIRRLACDELVVRYGMDVPFETDMFVREQQRVLGDIDVWAQRSMDTFKEGCFYYAGSLRF